MRVWDYACRYEPPAEETVSFKPYYGFKDRNKKSMQFDYAETLDAYSLPNLARFTVPQRTA